MISVVATIPCSCNDTVDILANSAANKMLDITKTHMFMFVVHIILLSSVTLYKDCYWVKRCIKYALANKGTCHC